MLEAKLVPTPLIAVAQRRAVDCSGSVAPSRFRGLELVIAALGVALRLAWLRARGQSSPQESGRIVGRVLERLGGLWVKLGQLLSLRVDLFSPEFCAELSRLQDRVKGFPGSEARAMLEASLGAPLENYFDEFELEPVAAASIGQVHRAVLRQERVAVAIKVRRPYVAPMVEREMRFLRLVVRLADLLGVTPHLRWRKMISELAQVMVEELDYRYEAASLQRMAKSLAPHKIYAPAVFAAYSSDCVLVTEFVEGVLMSDYIQTERTDPARLRSWCTENDVDPARVGRRLATSLMRQIFEDNLYHGDLHPGNIMLLRESRVALIDMGTVGATDRDFLEKYKVFMRSMGALELAKAADALILLGTEIPPIDVVELRAGLVSELQKFAARTHVTTLPYHERSVSSIAATLIGLLARFKCSPDWSFLRIRRAEQTLDASLVHLVPKLNYTKSVVRYFRGAERRALRSLFRRGRLAKEATMALGAAIELQRRTLETAIMTSALVRRGAFVFESTTTNAAHLFASMFRLMSAAMAAVAAFAVVMVLRGVAPASVDWLVRGPLSSAVRIAPRFGVTGWLIVAAAALYVARGASRMRSRFKERHVKDAR